jgi:hypothetical protein
MGTMKPFSLLTAGLIATALALAPATDAAGIVELGQTKTPLVAPVCPKGVAPTQCFIVLQRTTAIQTASDGIANPTVVKRSGWIVAFSIGISRLSPKAATAHNLLHTLDRAYGGTPQLALTVLKPGPRHTYTVAAQSGTYHLIPFLGQVLQEPLSLPPTFTAFTALQVKAGDVIGLTVPTWAPVLTYGLPGAQFSYRQSRLTNCKHSAGSQTAQLAVGMSTRYLCQYGGTRVEYSATEIANSPYPKTYVHPTRRPLQAR